MHKDKMVFMRAENSISKNSTWALQKDRNHHRRRLLDNSGCLIRRFRVGVINPFKHVGQLIKKQRIRSLPTVQLLQCKNCCPAQNRNKNNF